MFLAQYFCDRASKNRRCPKKGAGTRGEHGWDDMGGIWGKMRGDMAGYGEMGAMGRRGPHARPYAEISSPYPAMSLHIPPYPSPSPVMPSGSRHLFGDTAICYDAAYCYKQMARCHVSGPTTIAASQARLFKVWSAMPPQAASPPPNPFDFA